MRIFLTFFIAAMLAACSYVPGSSLITPYKMDIQQGNMVTPEMREKLKLGMSPALVRSILGEPLVTDPFHARRWDYVFMLEHKGKIVARQRLTLYFENDQLARIDDKEMPAMEMPAETAPALPASAVPAADMPASAVLATPVPAPAVPVNVEPLQDKK